MNCIRCGSNIGPEDRFCMSCGNPVAAAPTQTEIQGQPQVQTSQNSVALPYAPPALVNGNIIIPVGRKYRFVCPSCGSFVEDIKRDTTAGYPCPHCKAAYAYGGQVLIYKMGSWNIGTARWVVNLVVDGRDCGEMYLKESVRLLLSTGTHTIGFVCRVYNNSSYYTVNITPDNFNQGFKLNLISIPIAFVPPKIELQYCRPEEVPDI